MNLVLDVETTKFPRAMPWNGYLVSIHAYTSEGEARSWLYNHKESTQSQRDIVKEVQEYVDQCDRVIAHNLKFDLHWFDDIGLVLKDKKIYCTLVAEYILRGFSRMDGLSLDALAEYYHLPSKLDKVKMFWDSGYETDEIPADILIPYGEQDCITTMAVFNKQVPQITAPAYMSLEMEVIRDLQEAEYNGMLLDTDLLSNYHTDYNMQINELDRELLNIVGEDINMGSGDQLSCALYGGEFLEDSVEETERILKSGEIKRGTRKCKRPRRVTGLGFKPLPNTETKKEGIYKTDATTIMQLKAPNKKAKRFIETYSERAKLSTLDKTFFSGLLARVGDDKYVHPTINQTVTKTSRLSCSNPNLQNLPRGSTGPVKKAIRSRYESSL